MRPGRRLGLFSRFALSVGENFEMEFLGSGFEFGIEIDPALFAGGEDGGVGVFWL